MEWLVGTLVVLGFIAIAVRFVPRDAAGRARLPRMVEESIGMWAVRRLTGQADTNRLDDGDTDGPATPVEREPRREPASRFDAAPIGPAPIAPTVFVPSGSPTQARPMGDIGAGSARQPVTSPIIELKVLRRRPRSNRNVAMERRLVVLAALLAVGLVVLESFWLRAARGARSLARRAARTWSSRLMTVRASHKPTLRAP